MVLLYVSSVWSLLNLYMFIVFISLGKILVFFFQILFVPLCLFSETQVMCTVWYHPIGHWCYVIFFIFFFFHPLCALFQIFFFFLAMSSSSYIFSFAESNMLLIQSSEFFIWEIVIFMSCSSRLISFYTFPLCLTISMFCYGTYF